MAVTLLSGAAVDRFGAAGLTRRMLAPLGLGLLVLAASSHPLVVVPYMVLMGTSSGMVAVAGTATWAEL